LFDEAKIWQESTLVNYYSANGDLLSVSGGEIINKSLKTHFEKQFVNPIDKPDHYCPLKIS
jgi:hypothetical protein